MQKLWNKHETKGKNKLNNRGWEPYELINDETSSVKQRSMEEHFRYLKDCFERDIGLPTAHRQSTMEKNVQLQEHTNCNWVRESSMYTAGYVLSIAKRCDLLWESERENRD